MSNDRSVALAGAPPQTRPQGGFADYLSLARLDHATKHVFILPGLALAWALLQPDPSRLLLTVPIGFLSAVCIASSNYVINEWLDREADAVHPTKSKRRSVIVMLSAGLVYLEYAAFAVAGLVLALVVGKLFFAVATAFFVSGLVYNVPPLRTKDKPYLDVLTESVNNPIRFLLGWAMIENGSLPPVSILLVYWLAGAFLMATKRLGEYRDIIHSSGVGTLRSYRRSFRFYTEESLTISSFLYAMMTAFLLGVFLIKYRVEYVLTFPFLSGLFAVYLWLASRRGSVVQNPERLFHSRRLDAMLGATIVVGVLTTFVDMPFLHFLATPFLVALPPAP